MIQAIIEKKLQSELSPLFLQVVNESHQHNVPKGSESHFKVIIASEKFEGLRLLSRHRMVNNILEKELANDIHALGLNTYSVKEWKEMDPDVIPSSPKCLGGNNK